MRRRWPRDAANPGLAVRCAGARARVGDPGGDLSLRPAGSGGCPRGAALGLTASLRPIALQWEMYKKNLVEDVIADRKGAGGGFR